MATNQELAQIYLQRKQALDELDNKEPHAGREVEDLTEAEAREWLAWHDEWKPLSRATQDAAQQLVDQAGLASRHPMHLVPQAELLAKESE